MPKQTRRASNPSTSHRQNININSIVERMLMEAIDGGQRPAERPQWRATDRPDLGALLNIPQRERGMWEMPQNCELYPCREPMTLQRCDRNAMKLLKKFRHAPNTFIHAGYRTALLDEESEGVPHWVVECNGKIWDVVNAMGDDGLEFNYMVMNVRDYFEWSGWKCERRIRASAYDKLVEMWRKIDAEDE